jgi:hypothetical protein
MPARRKSSSKRVSKKASPKRRVVARRVRKSSKSPKKPVNKWVAHVKAMTKKLNLSYKDALSNPEVRKSYKA